MRVLKNSSIALGVEWTLHDSVSEAKKAAAGKKNALVVRKIISGECVQGICKSPPKTKKLQAGALLAAAVADDVLIYHSFGDGQAWVCAIREGIPLHGYDVVQDENMAKATLAEVMSYVPAGELYGNINGAKCSIDMLFSQASAADRKAATLAGQENPILIAALVGMIAVLGFAAKFMYQHFEKKSADPVAMQMQSNEETRRTRMAFEAQVTQARQTYWHATSPSSQFAIWYEVLRNLPVSVNGWTPSTFTCDVSTCQVIWRRDARALPSTVNYLPGSANAQSFKPNLNEMTTSFSIAKLNAIPHTQGLSRIDHHLLDVGANISQYKLALNSTQTAVTVAPPAGTQGVEPVTIGQEGGWKATGSNPLVAPEFLERIEVPGVVLTGISIRSLKIGKPNCVIELEGRYRVGT